MTGVTTSIIQDKRVKRKDDTFAVKLRITHNRIQRYYPINKSLTKEDWEKTLTSKPRKEFKALRVLFNGIEQKAISVIEKISPFTFQEFEKRFNEKKYDQNSEVLHLMNSYIEKLKKQERIGTADSYKCALNSIKKYLEHKKRKHLRFSDITTEWLEDYEKWMIKNKKSLNTIGIYLRSLRTILNIAKEEGFVSPQSYPFGKRKYVIPAGKNIKKALKLSDIKKIIEYTPENQAEKRARDLWIFSYLGNGLNIKDIALLKWENIDSDRITFYREKTRRSTKHNSRLIVILRNEKINETLSTWGTSSRCKTDFVFDILQKEDSPEKVMAKVRQASKTINKYMGRIGLNLELKTKPTTYTARHSYATVLKRAGTPIEVISENLGHTDLKTTENYLDSFEDDTKAKYQSKLLDFE